jgi:hypothetical protein
VLDAALFGAVLAARLDSGATAAFSTVFRATVPVMALALILGLLMREKPLSEEMVQIANGAAEAPEY